MRSVPSSEAANKVKYFVLSATIHKIHNFNSALALEWFHTQLIYVMFCQFYVTRKGIITNHNVDSKARKDRKIFVSSVWTLIGCFYQSILINQTFGPTPGQPNVIESIWRKIEAFSNALFVHQDWAIPEKTCAFVFLRKLHLVHVTCLGIHAYAQLTMALYSPQLNGIVGNFGFIQYWINMTAVCDFVLSKRQRSF